MALRHPADARPGGLLDKRAHLTARSQASTDRPRMLLSGTTQIKYPILNDKELDYMKEKSVSGSIHIPRLACPDPPLSTYRNSKRTNRSNSNTSRSASIGASTEMDIMEVEKIEDQIWELQQKIEWKKAQKSLNHHKRLQKSANASTWATNGRDVYMANRYRSQAMDTYGGYNSDVFNKATFTTKHQRVRKEFGRYGEALHHAKTTMRGNF
jgi:hypothetical protein